MKKRLKNNYKITILCSLLFALCSVGITKAAEPEVKISNPAYSAKFYSQSEKDPITIETGDTKTVTIKFKNAGTATWDSASSKYISAYTMEPRERSSVFKGNNWKSAKQTGKIEGKIKPGQVGELKINLQAPSKIGEYLEKFYLASENNSWVKGGYFYLKIKVIASATKNITDIVPAKNNEDESYQANRIILNKKEVKAPGGELIKIIIGFQNTGSSTWKNFKLTSGMPTALASVSRKLTFADNSWKNDQEIMQGNEEVAPGEFLRKEFYFRTPSLPGNYVASFQFQIDNKFFDDVAFQIPVSVTAEAPENYVEPTFENIETPRLSEEPRIRVGLYKPDTFVQFRSGDDDYNVFDGINLIGILPKNSLGVLNYEDGSYTFKGGELDFQTSAYIRLSPINNPHAVFTLQNYERKVSWKGPKNFNQYRGAMEYRMTQDGKNIYVINDLLFEDYVAGISETSNVSPIEYIKALLTAARTYAYYIQQNTDKHADRNFDVVATTGDQLYLGYGSEQIMPRVVQASQETRGRMITYENNIVITPYYGNSDGRTRAWTEVWGGTKKPWLVSVPAIYDKRDGKKMYGHGVGMSARDAAIKAEEESLGYTDIIKYYYTGVEVEKIY